MKKNKLSTLLVLVVLWITAVSCDRAVELSQSDIITAEWEVTQVVIDGTVDNISDYSNYTFSFNRDMAYSFTQAPAAEVETEGTWMLSDDSKFLYLSGNNGTETVVPINKLNDNHAELVFTIPATFKSAEKMAIFFLERK